MPPYNPYAPPGQGGSSFGPYGAPPLAPGGIGEPEPWEVGEVLRQAWEIYRGQWAPLTFGLASTTLLAMMPGQVSTALVIADRIEKESSVYWAIHIPCSVVGWLIDQWFAAGAMRAGLSAARGQTASFGDFFSGGGAFLPYLGMSLLRSLALALGFCALVVPGIILALGLANAPFYVIDQKRSPFDAMTASWESTKGQKGNLFVLGLAEVGLALLGLVACCLGELAVLPVLLLVRAIVYIRMSGAKSAPVPL